jgi:hypothetical protein
MAKHPKLVIDEGVLLKMAKIGNIALAELERRGFDVRGATAQDTAQKLKLLKRKLRSEPPESK